MNDIDNDKDNLLKRWEQEDKEREYQREFKQSQREYQREYKRSQREHYWKGSSRFLNWIGVAIVILVLLKACSGVSSKPLPNDWDGDGDNNWDKQDTETYFRYKSNQ
ncbi:hypothetical protein [Paenibacillus xylanilyticus]|uniref:Uncharacterized protein n=1 Tax=Paenibacillus xylanilyticus TaxID=248903 RepID=A0A7Y6BV22_9BACL|nr:hypothetical protein [Paenibacillus xylanilyticus]NUU75336.1 hypothetical protein [Paenibacillus xylanilyticus]